MLHETIKPFPIKTFVRRFVLHHVFFIRIHQQCAINIHISRWIPRSLQFKLHKSCACQGYTEVPCFTIHCIYACENVENGRTFLRKKRYSNELYESIIKCVLLWKSYGHGKNIKKNIISFTEVWDSIILKFISHLFTLNILVSKISISQNWSHTVFICIILEIVFSHTFCSIANSPKYWNTHTYITAMETSRCRYMQPMFHLVCGINIIYVPLILRCLRGKLEKCADSSH